MKHLLNNLTEQEKSNILEQHKGGIKIWNKNFKHLCESKLGNVKPLLNEQSKQILFAGSTPNATEFNKYVQEVGNDWQGFMGIQFTTDSLIKNVVNHYEGGSSKSQRNDLNSFIRLSGSDEKEILGFSFATVVDKENFLSLFFTLSKDGQEIAKSETYSYRGPLNVKSMCRGNFYLTNLNTTGKYTLTNSIDKSYYLTFEI
jgi:hypothetical protein